VAGTEEARPSSLFDLRMVIGGLLALYGVICTGLGLFGSQETKSKAAGLNINLWAGLAMIVVGAVFVAWVRLRPLKAEESGDDGDHAP
jgi:hypothetical protein